MTNAQKLITEFGHRLIEADIDDDSD